MKKFFCSLLTLAVLLISATTLAASKETIPANADLTAVKRLAVALPMHYKTATAEPTVAELTQIMFDASKSTRFYVISYDEIAANIQRETGVDIKALSDLEARKIFAANIARYADAFVTVTTINSEDDVQLYFEVQNAANGEFLYVLTSKGGIGKNSADYLKACENFYSKFNSAVEKQLKAARKKK